MRRYRRVSLCAQTIQTVRFICHQNGQRGPFSNAQAGLLGPCIIEKIQICCVISDGRVQLCKGAMHPYLGMRFNLGVHHFSDIRNKTRYRIKLTHVHYEYNCITTCLGYLSRASDVGHGASAQWFVAKVRSL